MKLLKERILKDGKVIGEDILRVDSFLNHQLDIGLFNEIGKEFKRRFKGNDINKILTIETSGIGIACIVAQYFDVPVVFAKKHQGTNMDMNTYEAEVFSFTKNTTYNIRVAKEYIKSDDKILIIDDFLAQGKAVDGLMEIANQGNAEVVGIGIVIEKAFQNAREQIESKGLKLESLAIIDGFKDGNVIFK
ncbi:xanthine phosphoribosyltransferase [Clostridium sediminicola]|uniref:xanthine phosphoribosyltransferase n=1 Tax=Clostridium sediminicola TaxID=3114879 RepID=UPI0031F1DBE0